VLQTEAMRLLDTGRWRAYNGDGLKRVFYGIIDWGGQELQPRSRDRKHRSKS